MGPGELSLPGARGSAVQRRRPCDPEKPRTENQVPTSAQPGRGCAWCEHWGLAELRIWDRRSHHRNLGLPLWPHLTLRMGKRAQSLILRTLQPAAGSLKPLRQETLDVPSPSAPPQTHGTLSITCAAVRGRDAGPGCSPLLPLTSLRLPRSCPRDRAPSPCGRGWQARLPRAPEARGAGASEGKKWDAGL